MGLFLNGVQNNIYASTYKTEQKLKYGFKFVCKSYEGSLKLNAANIFYKFTS